MNTTATDKVDVLDHGYVRLVDHMGSDLSVVNAARVSFDKRSDWDYETVAWVDPFTPEQEPAQLRTGKKSLKSGDKKLIQFLAKNGHWSPFAHPQLQFEVKCPMLVKNQWIKHRIGMSYLTDEDAESWDNEGWNETSLRYVSPKDFHIPPQGAWRAAPANKKQGSGANLSWKEFGVYSNYLTNITEKQIKVYNEMLERGVAPEQARLILPMYAMYTSFYWTTSLYGVARFLQLRLKEDAQYEIRQYARAVQKLSQPLFPESLGALMGETSTERGVSE